ncbi:unnamed protein product [Soboliphyme baturini]|uniref:Uncharacterized protein n=1 Tax=Soboliphyme baturini TaxID=241478 RepID=A0A183JAG9_9BILA|nr:unnamed protein product [Soboliphyme baturini]
MAPHQKKRFCGLLFTRDDHAPLRVSKSFTLLLTDSPKVKTLATAELRHTVSLFTLKRLRDVSTVNLRDFLNGADSTVL